MTPIVVFDLDNTLVHSRIDFLGIRQAIIGRLVDVGALAEPPADPRVRAIPEWLDVAAEFDPALVTRTVVGTATLSFANGNAATFARRRRWKPTASPAQRSRP